MNPSSNQLIITVAGRNGAPATYEMGNAQAFVRHSVRLMTDRWGTNLSTGVPKGIIEKARLLAERHGTPYAGFSG